jgi:hypothetical protein
METTLNIQTLIAAGFDLSKKSAVLKKQVKLLTEVQHKATKFRYFGDAQSFDTSVKNLKSWWNRLSPEVRNHPDLLKIALYGSSSYSPNVAGWQGLDSMQLAARAQTLANANSIKIPNSGGLTFLTWMAANHKKLYSGEIRFDVTSVLSLLDSPRIDRYYKKSHENVNLVELDNVGNEELYELKQIDQPWWNTQEWENAKKGVFDKVMNSWHEIHYASNWFYRMKDRRDSRISEHLRFHRLRGLQETVERIKTRILNVAPINWDSHLRPIENKWALRERPKGRCIGFELEFICVRDSEIQEWDTNDYPRMRWFNFCSDGSIGTDREDETLARYQEFKAFVDIANPQDWDNTHKILNILTSSGARINKTCGCHIHVDMRDRAQSTYYRVAERMKCAFVNWAHGMISPNRALNRYCPVFGGGSGRYKAINTECWNEHRTIEIRCGMPTLNFTKLRLWAGLMHWMVYNSTKIDTFKEFMESDCPLQLKIYAVDRIAKFHNKWNAARVTHQHSGVPQQIQDWESYKNIVDSIKNCTHEFTQDSSVE